MPYNDEDSDREKPVKPPKQRCKVCKEPITGDGYGDWVHWDGFYMCESKEGEVATA